MKAIDPAGKDKIILLSSHDTSRHHWNKQTRIRWTITYFFGIFLVYGVRTSMSISVTAIAKDLGWNKQVSGMALSAFFCGYITTNVLGGYLADRHGGELIIFYSTIGWSMLTTLLPILATSQSMLYSGTTAVLAVRFLTGVTQGVFFPSVLSLLATHVSVSERGLVYSFAYSGSSVGTIATGFIGSVIIEKIGWPFVFIILGILTLFWVAWLRFQMKASKRNLAIDFDNLSKTMKEPVPWLKLASSTAVWALFISYFCSSYCFYNLLSWAPVYFHDAFPESKGWIFNVVPWLLNFIVTNISGYITNIMITNGTSITFLRKLYASVMFLGITFFSILLNSVENFQQGLFVMSLNIAVNAFATSSISLNSQDLAPKHAGSLHGVMNSCGAFAGFIGVYLTGYILEITERWSSVFFVTSVVSFFGFLSYVIFGSGERVV